MTAHDVVISLHGNSATLTPRTPASRMALLGWFRLVTAPRSFTPETGALHVDIAQLSHLVTRLARDGFTVSDFQ